MKTAVSSLFKKPVQPPPANLFKAAVPKPKKKKIAPKLNTTDATLDNKQPKESPFLRRLKQQQMGIKLPPPVPTKDAYNENVPIGGFGEICLRRQGWEPGLKIGEIEVEDENEEK
ncbi:hypothetical protein TRFO_21050 [Tritrichomonas foetus]|uniref:G-patch domain-containing protein n=1 Tax=Tritrichomonas foetus TaxID=1144522 RepID=A0A1J4KET9_9EUKA|nr:hypothetical protein TRFO_21050 [Tritrichomonas foetus]|eukprot:OHT09951.1 hypothetical protein TRFO_21050 [Tritrichomonas foetus]